MIPRLFVVAAPSGAGKSSFVERIAREDQRVRDIVTYTTRPMRKGESQGFPYYFVSESEFKRLVEGNFFAEWAHVHTKMYGTSKKEIESTFAAGKCGIMDVDVQGVHSFKKLFPETISIFILPPGIDELRQRIIKRDGRVPEDLEVRMKNAEKEISFAPEFDFQVVNDDFERSYQVFKKIIVELLAKK